VISGNLCYIYGICDTDTTYKSCTTRLGNLLIAEALSSKEMKFDYVRLNFTQQKQWEQQIKSGLWAAFDFHTMIVRITA
jgi:hypothetical protein